jgi:hypothetical protein
VDNLSWRWVFYINLPIGAAALAVIIVVLPASSTRRKHTIDYLGAVLLAGFATTVVLATSWGGTTYPWGSPEIIGLFAASVVFIVAWWLAERRAAEPVLPLRLFRNPVFRVSSAISLAAGFALFGSISFLPLFLQGGARRLAHPVRCVPAADGRRAADHLDHQRSADRPHRPVQDLPDHRHRGARGGAVPAVPAGREHPDGADERLLLRARLRAGADPPGPGHRRAERGRLRRPRCGDVRGHLLRSIGGAFGVSVFGAIFSNQLARELASALRGITLPPGFNAASSQANPALLKTLPAALRDAIGHAYSLALHPVFLWAIPLAVVAFILSWFLREVPLRTTSSVGIGEGLGATPPARSSVDEVERALVRLGGEDIRGAGTSG